MLHIIFTSLLVLVGIATALFAGYVVYRLFKTGTPATAKPSPSVDVRGDRPAN